MKINKTLAFFLILAMSASSALAQVTVSGTVVDNNDSPIPGVNVVIQGTTEGVQTDFDGNFSIATIQRPPIVLVFSYIGAQSKLITIKENEILYVRMEEEIKVLEEIYVVGDDAKAGEFPWTVSLKKYGNKRKIWCGGVVIGSRWLLSCAHCFQDRDNLGNVTSWLGKKDIFVSFGNINHKKGRTVGIEKIFYPEGKQAYSAESGENDIVLIKLKKAIIKERNSVKRIRVVSDIELQNSYLTDKITAVGWGSTKTEPAPLILKKTTFPLKSFEECRKEPSMGKSLKSNMICFGDEPVNIFCPGDSGNGVFYNNTGAFKLIGLITSGSKCINDYSNNKRYSTLTSVLPYKPWIDKKMTQ
ncbi:trypsin-like serine protease [Maribacter sp. 2308TA10-17]|uniref:serine protease n=1 Tax=Maribacter sp. 2308TA10-17 TaxID=3386276 RepID=UPI0039BD8F6B